MSCELVIPVHNTILYPKNTKLVLAPCYLLLCYQLRPVRLIGIFSQQFVKKIHQDATMYQNFIIPYLYEAQHVSGETPPTIRSLKLHWQPLVFLYVEGCWTSTSYTSNNLPRMKN